MLAFAYQFEDLALLIRLSLGWKIQPFTHRSPQPKAKLLTLFEHNLPHRLLLQILARSHVLHG